MQCYQSPLDAHYCCRMKPAKRDPAAEAPLNAGSSLMVDVRCCRMAATTELRAAEAVRNAAASVRITFMMCSHCRMAATADVRAAEAARNAATAARVRVTAIKAEADALDAEWDGQRPQFHRHISNVTELQKRLAAAEASGATADDEQVGGSAARTRWCSASSAIS